MHKWRNKVGRMVDMKRGPGGRLDLEEAVNLQ